MMTSHTIQKGNIFLMKTGKEFDQSMHLQFDKEVLSSIFICYSF